MAEIRPFQGVHYSKSLIEDLSAVICPPYDIISPQQRQELYAKSEYNFVRLEYTRELPQDTPTDNKYTRAAATLEQWLEQGILETDPTPAIYLYDQYFKYQKKQYKRCSLIACVRLEEWEKGIVRPHEGTIAEAKSDRLSLLWALQANTSPILAMYQDPKQQIATLLTKVEQDKPLLDTRSSNGEGHSVWAITKPQTISQIRDCLAGQSLYIADGHHRYESALTYRREKSARGPVTGDEPFNFVLMTLVDFADPGLLILPPHRLVRGIAKSTLDELMPKLELLFEIDRLPLGMPDVWSQTDNLIKTDETKLVLFGLNKTDLLVLKPRDQAAINQMMPYFHSELYKRLDVSIIDHVILEELLGLSGGKENTLLAYSYDRQDAINRVIDQEYQLALLVRPAKAETIKAIADVGDKMPRKSTYFYPKLPAGLIVYRLV
ncbi:MAG: DUF1015 domain-containing protein [Chloroflexota bacterium]